MIIRGSFKPRASTRCGQEPSQERHPHAGCLPMRVSNGPDFPAPTAIGKSGPHSAIAGMHGAALGVDEDQEKK